MVRAFEQARHSGAVARAFPDRSARAGTGARHCSHCRALFSILASLLVLVGVGCPPADSCPATRSAGCATAPAWPLEDHAGPVQGRYCRERSARGSGQLAIGRWCRCGCAWRSAACAPVPAVPRGCPARPACSYRFGGAAACSACRQMRRRWLGDAWEPRRGRRTPVVALGLLSLYTSLSWETLGGPESIFSRKIRQLERRLRLQTPPIARSRV